jgi:hypothetical protein
VSPLTFSVVESRPEPHAAVPTLLLRVRITADSPDPVHAIALRCQLMIEPQRRRYERDEEEMLVDLFGESSRWGDTLRPFLWTNVSLTVPGFTSSAEIDLPVACSYDMEIAATRYFHGLADGHIPVVLLFSGTVFRRGGNGLDISPIAWHEQASYRLPMETWRAVMDAYFPNSGWLRLHRDTLDALQRFRGNRALVTWDEAMLALLKEAGEEP